MRDFIPYGRQWITEADIDAVVTTLQSSYLTQGPAIELFEQAICDYTGAKFCVAVANGTAALHLAVASLELPKESKGITSPITFAASANCMLYNGITPVFADIDPVSYNIDPAQISHLINDTVKLLIPVHFAGQPVDMVRISEIAINTNLRVIEDAAHAIGSTYSDGTRVGNCKYSDLTIFSFHPVKTITTGEGGAITTNSRELYEKLLMLRSHGITRDLKKMSQAEGPWYYEMLELGYNYRLTDMQAALGISQLSRLNSFKRRRRAIVERYTEAFNGLSWLKTPVESPDVESCFHLYVLGIDFKSIGKSRTEVMEVLRRRQIGTQVHYIPVYQLPYYRQLGRASCGEAERYYQNCLSIPLFPSMTDDEVNHVINSIKQIV